MGMVLTNTGMAAGAQFDAFYLGGNWEKGDHDGNGFVNQQDANWLAGRYTALGVTLPDRLAYSGTFESFPNSKGLTGRWRAGRNAQNNLNETSNFKQEATNYLSWSGTGIGASRRSNSFVTIRNQNSAENAAATNSQARSMQADLTTPIDLGSGPDVFFTLVVRENASLLSPSQLASSNRTLSLQLLNSLGVNQYDITLSGLDHVLAIQSQADATGQDVSGGTFGSDTTYLLVGKIAGNGTGANTLQASLFPSGAVVGDFSAPSFAWMLTAVGGAGYNPVITQMQLMSLAEGNFTVSNLWIGNAATMIPEPGSVSLILLGILALSSRRAGRRI
jgi:hypothetical protein